VLTDYHVHLRPDGAEHRFEEAFTTTNAERYQEVAAERGVQALGVSEHVYRFRQALDVWDHPYWREHARDDIDAYCEFVREATSLKLGIEADYVAGAEDRMASLLEGRDWDYVLGSVHFIQGGALDMEGDWDIWRSGDVEKVWMRYFETLGEAARSGMFDVLAHPDLVKVWGDADRRPRRDLRFYYDAAMDGIADSDVTIEVSTAGLRKPVGEIYPAREFLEMCIEAGRPVALSSDAHTPNDLAYRYDDALEFLESLEIGEIAVFDRRERRLEPVG
jgi:histidinol-phosphatase (PHP family)